MSKSVTYFVRNEPFWQMTGNTSHGTHVTTSDGPEAARNVGFRLGREVVEVTECPDIWTCRCTENARLVNALAFPDYRHPRTGAPA